jgi:hypothetical protein
MKFESQILKGKDHLERPVLIYEDNIKIDFKHMVMWTGFNWPTVTAIGGLL